MVQVTVIIPHHNRIDLLRECLLSLRDQSFPDVEVTVVDNGSSDGSREAIAAEFPEVHIIPLPQNRGFSAACNEGIRATTSPFVLLLHNDVSCDRDLVKELVSALEADHDYAWAAPLSLQTGNPSGIDNCGLFFSWVGIARKRCAGAPRESVGQRPMPIFGAAGNAAMFRRSFFTTVGLFDERFLAYCEDWELALRAHGKGIRCVFVPPAVCFHSESSTWGRNSDLTIHHFQRNMELAYFRCWGWRFHLRYLLPHLAYSFYCVLRWTWRGRGRIALKAKWEAANVLLTRAGQRRADSS